jgi:galactose mutarotase-like enzyme
MHILSNESIQISVKTLGAELSSLKKVGDKHEYMWVGDSNFWAGQSPVLFPIVGSVRNETATIAHKDYQLKNHGFARRSEFELRSATPDKLVFALKYNAATLAQYPYRFELRLIYTLDAASVTITYEIENLDDNDIHFQLGTHPGFNCPMASGLTLSDYYLEFEVAETAKRYFCNSSNLIINGKEAPILNDSETLALRPETFYEGALIFRDIQSQSVILKSDKDEHFVKVSWQNFPYLGVWQPKDAPFVCIEPWHGLGDNDTVKTDFEGKEQIVTLAPDKIFTASISISL